MTKKKHTCDRCERPAHARGLCAAHYNRWKRGRDVQAEPLLNLSSDIEERFWARVHKVPAECWTWQSTTSPGGYGVFRFKNNKFSAHVWAYRRFVGPVPEGLQLDHLCHTRDTSCSGGDSCPHRRCVNPEHLEPVTPRENTLRGKSIQAANADKTHCVNGHPFSAMNTRISPQGTRVCKACQRAATARYKARRRLKINPQTEEAA